MHKRKLGILFIVLAASVVFTMLFKSHVHVVCAAYSREDGKKAEYLSVSFPFVSVTCRTDEQYFPGTRILELNTCPAIFLGIIRHNGYEYILSADTAEMSLYTLEGTKFGYYAPTGTHRGIVSLCTADMDRNGTDEILVLTGENGYGNSLLMLSWDGNSQVAGIKEGFPFKVLYSYPMDGLKPWKVQTADIDGDGKLEISVGVYKTAKFHPVPSKRPFMYGWSKEGIYPVWLGSRLSHPFNDYIFADADGDGMDELASAEQLSDGKMIVNLYKWKGFGFEAIGSSEGFADIRDIRKSGSSNNKGGKISASTRVGWMWKKVDFKYKAGKLLAEQYP